MLSAGPPDAYSSKIAIYHSIRTNIRYYRTDIVTASTLASPQGQHTNLQYTCPYASLHDSEES